MGKSLGSSKTGGRTKGTPNKRTLAFGEVLEARRIDLLGEILDAAQGLPEREKVRIYLDLLPYQYPKRKPSEAAAASASLAEQLSKLSRDQLHELKDDVTMRLGLDKNYDKMDANARADYDRTIEELKRMIRVEDELGTGPD